MENTPFLYYPVKNPINQNNLFGANPSEYAPLGQKGHPGEDFECPVGTPVYAPCDGAAFYATDGNGGCGIYIRTPDAPSPTANIILWHMVPAGTPEYPYSIPTEKGTLTDVKAGQLLGYSGDSGYPKESTGPHLHLGVMPIGANELALNPGNGYLGCVDPAPFFNGKFAEDIATEQQVVEKTAAVVSLVSQATDQQIPHQQKLDILAEIEQFLQKYL